MDAARKRSVVWGFFKTTDCESVQCLLCSGFLPKHSHGSTTSMLRHLRVKHPTVACRESNGQVAETTASNDINYMDVDGEQFYSVEVALEDGDSDILSAENETGMNSADINGVQDLSQESPAEQTTRAEASDDHPLVPTQHKRSLIWRYFQLLDSLDAARCRICMKKLQYSYGSTHNLHRHLSRRHPKVFSELVANRKQPPPLSSSQHSKSNGDTDETFCATEQRRVPVEVKLEDGDSNILSAEKETGMNSADINGVQDLSQEGSTKQTTRSEASDDPVGRTHKRSLIWRYFQQLNSLDAARCRICMKKLQYSYGSTHNLHRHLSRRHPKVFSELVANRKQPPPLSSSQDSKSNGDTDETFLMTEQRRVSVEVKLEDGDSDILSAEKETGMNSADINGVQDLSQEGSTEQTTRSEASDDPVGRTHKRSLIWRYFQQLDSLDAARCRICMKKLQYSYGSTHNLHRHLSRRHPKVFSELVANRKQPPPLSSSQHSKRNGDTKETFCATAQRRVPCALKVSGASEGERRVFRRERELIEALRRTQREEARALEDQRELLEKLRAAHAREAAAEREKIESLRKAQQEEAKELSRQREELQKEKAELQKKWEELQ